MSYFLSCKVNNVVFQEYYRHVLGTLKCVWQVRDISAILREICYF